MDPLSQSQPTWVNDVHSALNPTRVARIATPHSVEGISQAIRHACEENLPLSLSGCRHAMGGQQFVSDGLLVDLRGWDEVLDFDRQNGLIRAGAGIQWQALISSYLAEQSGDPEPWGISQKQTGADGFTLGGTLSANAHGRGLTLRPIISDVEALTLMNAQGELQTCSRRENSELFSLVVGGYGLFGAIVDVTLRLTRRQRIERVVEVIRADEVIDKFNKNIAAGFLYGDFQFSIDERSTEFLQTGVFSSYRPTDRPATSERSLDESDWLTLLHLAHTDRRAAFAKYVDHYLSTNGQVYWSDTHQLSPYLPDYARRIRHQLEKESPEAGSQPTSLMITELYVPRENLANFLKMGAKELRDRGIVVIYGTVRLIEKDTESFLAWARESFACIIFNLLVEHTPEGREKSAAAFRALIDLALAFRGSYYLTYHRFADKQQVETCYPQFAQFLALKKQHDPDEVFQSDWYRHYCGLFG